MRWGRGSVRRYRERERTVRERESIVEAVPREDILRIAEPVAVPQKGCTAREDVLRDSGTACRGSTV